MTNMFKMQLSDEAYGLKHFKNNSLLDMVYEKTSVSHTYFVMRGNDERSDQFEEESILDSKLHFKN